VISFPKRLIFLYSALGKKTLVKNERCSRCLQVKVTRRWRRQAGVKNEKEKSRNKKEGGEGEPE
jgi:hypothetical protein